MPYVTESRLIQSSVKSLETDSVEYVRNAHVVPMVCNVVQSKISVPTTQALNNTAERCGKRRSLAVSPYIESL